MDYLDILDPQPFIIEVDGVVKAIDPVPIFVWFREEQRVREGLVQFCAGKWGTGLEMLADAFESVTGLDPGDWSLDDLDALSEFLKFFMDVYMPPELLVGEKPKEEPKNQNGLLLELEAIITTQLSLEEFRRLTFSHALVLYVRLREEQVRDKEVAWYSGQMGWERQEQQLGNKISVSYKPRSLPWDLPWRASAANAEPPRRLAPPDEDHVSPFIKLPGKVRNLKNGEVVGEKNHQGG